MIVMTVKFTVLLPALLVLSSPGASLASAPPVASEGSMFISETCEGKITTASLDWKLHDIPGQRTNYVITRIDVTDGNVSLLTESQRNAVLQDLNRWTQFSLLSVSNVRPICSQYKTEHLLLLDVRYQHMHWGGPLFDTLKLDIDLNDPSKTGLYATRLIDGKVQQVPAAIAEIPPWKDPPAKK